MSKNRLGLRRAGGAKSSPRVQGLAAGRGTGIAPDMHLKRPYLPQTPQENTRDADNTGRISGLGKKR